MIIKIDQTLWLTLVSINDTLLIVLKKKTFLIWLDQQIQIFNSVSNCSHPCMDVNIPNFWLVMQTKYISNHFLFADMAPTYTWILDQVWDKEES